MRKYIERRNDQVTLVLEYTQRFLSEWITNYKKLNFEAAFVG